MLVEEEKNHSLSLSAPVIQKARRPSVTPSAASTTAAAIVSRQPTIPYTSIFRHTASSEFFLAEVPIEAKIINYEDCRSVLSLSQYLYHIELRHGPFSWIIKRRYAQFRALHSQIWLFYQTLTLPLPTQNNRENRKVLAKMGDIDFPKFPMIPETIFINQSISKRIKLLEEYLQFILSLSLFRNHPSVLTFLQISPFSFIADLGFKGEEFLVKKRAGGFRKAAFCTRVENFFTDLTGHWRNRWLIVKDTCLFYYRPKDRRIRYVMLFDADFFADSGLGQTGVQHGVRIRNASRQLVVKTKNAKDLAEYLNEFSRLYAKEFLILHRFGSFAPIRRKSACQWLVDGAAHFEAVSQALESASEEIYIADWWLSPEIYLQRPSLGHHWRLDVLLQKKAREGVKVFILLYKEVELGISISSVYTKRTLMKAHPNISVLRHPDAVRGGPLLWSHHEKLVVIDQKYAFVGGIDLCFGRWDNYQHRLTDLGGIVYKNAEDTLVIHNSTKPTGLTYRSVSQPILTPPSLEIISPISALKVEKSLDGHLLVPGSSSSPPAGTPTLFAQGVKSSSTTRLITVHRLNTADLTVTVPPTNTVDDDDDDDQEDEDEVEDDRIEEEVEDEHLSEVDKTIADKDSSKNNSLPAAPPKHHQPQSAKSPTPPERKYRTRLGMGNMRHRISTKIRNKRIAAISKFRKINRRLRGAAAASAASLRKSSDAGLDNISYISSDLIEQHPDYFKQAIPRLRAQSSRLKDGRRKNSNSSSSDDGYDDQVATDQLEGAAKLWIGKDYTNFIVKDFSNLNLPFQDSVDRHSTPRMPWHDVSCMVVGAAARDVARHFIQRWNHAKYSKVKFNDRYPWLIPKSYAGVEQTPVPPFLLRTHPVTLQVLRSVSSWSAGVKRTEASIVDAYIEAISNADHYIYIENQFFISQTKTHTESGVDVVKNRIAEALYRRIIRAHRNGQTFRVYILIPLLPAFEGEIGTSSGFNIQQITHYNYATITKGPHSLLGKLRAEIDDPSRYIGFYSLRSWAELNGRLVTELTYIHSKILIADDHLVIIGSANINDRSMLGSRDSEVAVIVEDEEFDTTSYLMNGKPYRSGRFAGSLRRMLMREHLGIYNQEVQQQQQQAANKPSVKSSQSSRSSTSSTSSSSSSSSSSHSNSNTSPSTSRPEVKVTPSRKNSAATNTSFTYTAKKLSLDCVNDPTCEAFWTDTWNATARLNTLIYEQVFPVIPSDEIQSFSAIPEYMAKAKLCKVDRVKAAERLAVVQGSLVSLPLAFLSRETSANGGQQYSPQDHFIPNIVWT